MTMEFPYTRTTGPVVGPFLTGLRDGRILGGRCGDVDLFAQPIDFTQFARSYPGLPARGPHTGPLKVQGTMADLVLVSTMRGDSVD